MSKILLIAEKIKDQAAFMRKIKEITHKSFAEIKDCLLNHTPFFEGSTTGNEGEANEKAILEILRFAKREGAKLKIFLQATKEPFEITEESFHNSVKRREEIRRQLDELDEMECTDDEEGEA